MVVVRRNTTVGFSQERLAKEDIRLLIEAVIALHINNTKTNDLALNYCGVYSNTRLELLIGKLKRMLK